MSWRQYLAIIQDASDPDFRGDDIEKLLCPNDAYPLREDNGVWHCPFDGYRSTDPRGE